LWERVRPALSKAEGVGGIIFKISGGNLFQGNTVTKRSRAIFITTRILSGMPGKTHPKSKSIWSK